jgi:hypothetical protein
MNSIATITPSRGGERPQFIAFCLTQLNRMKPQETIIVSHKSQGPYDLIPRIKAGIQQAREMGIDRIAIVEDDDYYPADYLSHINLDDYDFWGWGTTYYYHIKNRTWNRSYHQDTHSSLFCTAFRISALDGFVWPPDDYLWLDLALWKFARHNRRFHLSLEEPPCLGIKHGVGKVAGKAHQWEMKNKDPDLSWLKSKVDAQAFEFYSNLKF